LLTLLSGLPRRDFSTGVCESNSNWKQREETNVQGLELSIWGFSSVVRSEAFQHTVGAIGLVEASSENVSISTAVSGLVVKVFINAGDRVNAGQPLFSLDDRDLRAETVTRQATLEAARDRLGKLEQSPRPEEIPPAEARVREAEAALADASVQVKLIESVTDRRAIREEDLQRRRLAAKAAEAKLDETKAALALLKAGPWAPDLKIAKAEVTTAEAQLKRLQTDIERLTMRAPVTGEILQVNVRAGEYAQVGLFSLVRVFDCRSLTGGASGRTSGHRMRVSIHPFV
jgi:multidrug resistance efflux pump